MAVAIAPDAQGYGPVYEELAERFCAAGIHAIAFDNMRDRRDEQYADLDHAIREIRTTTGAERLYLVGFSKGARLAFNCSAERDDLDGMIGFYGTPRARRSDDFVGAPLDNVDRMRVPILGFFGGEDVDRIPEAVVGQFDDALTRRGLPHHIVWYPRAPHSFFDRLAAEFPEECDDAWQRMLGFIRTGDPAARA